MCAECALIPKSPPIASLIQAEGQLGCGKQTGLDHLHEPELPGFGRCYHFGCRRHEPGKPESRIRRKWATQMNFKLKARVSRSDARTIRHALEQLAAKGSVRKADEEFIVEAEIQGDSARELNRTLLSALRKAERKTTLRAEWTSSDNLVERFFDYVLKKTIRN